MKKTQGPSIYYASDKNIFEALLQHKVDAKTIYSLFERRNTIVSKKTDRENLAKYFSRLTHDYHDHKNISARLGVSPRRERITSMDIKGTIPFDSLRESIESLKQEFSEVGDVVQTTRDGENISVSIQYSHFNYKLSEFSQVQIRDGVIEFEKTSDGYLVRNTQNEFINNARDSIIGKIERTQDEPVETKDISLFDITSHKLRNKFFYQLITTLPQLPKFDVTDIYVYKARPEQDDDPEDDDDNGHVEFDAHIEKVLLKGNDVTRSELLNDLVDDDTYHIIKAGWHVEDKLKTGNIYAIEALFSDSENCQNFSFLLRGVYPFGKGGAVKRRVPPTRDQIDSISRVIEDRARELIEEIREEFFSQESQVSP